MPTRTYMITPNFSKFANITPEEYEKIKKEAIQNVSKQPKIDEKSKTTRQSSYYGPTGLPYFTGENNAMRPKYTEEEKNKLMNKKQQRQRKLNHRKDDAKQFLLNLKKNPLLATKDAILHFIDIAGGPDNAMMMLRDLNVSIPHRVSSAIEAGIITLINKNNFHDNYLRALSHPQPTDITPLTVTEDNFSESTINALRNMAQSPNKGITAADIKREDGIYGENKPLSEYFTPNKVAQTTIGQAKGTNNGISDIFDFNTQKATAQHDNAMYLNKMKEDGAGFNYATLRALSPHIFSTDIMPNDMKIQSNIKLFDGNDNYKRNTVTFDENKIQNIYPDNMNVYKSNNNTDNNNLSNFLSQFKKTFGDINQTISKENQNLINQYNITTRQLKSYMNKKGISNINEAIQRYSNGVKKYMNNSVNDIKNTTNNIFSTTSKYKNILSKNNITQKTLDVYKKALEKSGKLKNDISNEDLLKRYINGLKLVKKYVE